MVTLNFGYSGESLACRYLEEKGMVILDRNYRIRGGEIDIVARDNGELVFVEVKTRSSHRFGLPVESITSKKIEALQKAALVYMSRFKTQPSYRFDAVSIDYTDSFGRPVITHYPNITL